MTTAEEISYPGIGLLITLGGSLVLWFIIFWMGYAIYAGLTQ